MSRTRFLQVFALVSFYLVAIGASSPVDFSPVQAARLEPDRSTQPEPLISEPVLLPDGAISLAPSPLLTTTVTAAETEAETVDITIRETAPGAPPDVSAYGPDGPITVTVEVVAEEEGELIEESEAEAVEEEFVEGEPLPEGFEEGGPEDEEPAPPGAVQVAPDPYDHWELLMREDFENDALPPKCGRYHAASSPYAFWGPDDHRPFRDRQAGWPARTGTDGVDPAVRAYPPRLDTSIKCGPYDRSQVRTMMVRYARWVDGTDPGDVGEFGVSFDGEEFTYLRWRGLNRWQPVQFTLALSGGPGQVWFKWRFRSDGDAHRGEGAWLDELEIWRYNQPAQTCGERDPGRKGIVVEPYMFVFDQEYPIIRPGYHDVLDALVESDVRWVRLGFKRQDDGIIKDLVQRRHYDYMVDALCAKGISVLGLVNQQTIRRQDSNDENTAADYRAEFADKVDDLARHFRGRINYWEIWNEPNYELNLTDKPDPPLVRPDLYAALLVETAAAIRAVNPEAKILSGGLSGAWDDAFSYFEEVYRALDALGQARPFDYFAVHPYFDDKHGLDPNYLLAEPPTILAKFTQKLAQEGDGHKPIWVTEFGWNSAAGQPPDCWPHRVTEQQQAEYLKRGFDTFFSRVPLAMNNACPAVSHAFVYQLLDTRIPADSFCVPNDVKDQAGAEPQTRTLPTGSRGLIGTVSRASANTVAWLWGIYRLNTANKLEAKPAQCVFARYPESCQPPPTPTPLPHPRFHYLPVIMRGTDPSCPQ